jgi:hypothetical protein
LRKVSSPTKCAQRAAVLKNFNGVSRLYGKPRDCESREVSSSLTIHPNILLLRNWCARRSEKPKAFVRFEPTGPKFMRASYNGSTTAFQAVRMGSIPIARSSLRYSDIGSPRRCQRLRTGSIPVCRSKFIVLCRYKFIVLCRYKFIRGVVP